MAYGNKYILGSSNELNDFFEVYLDYLNYTGASTIIAGAVDAFKILSNSGEEDKFTPVIGLECDISIFVGKINSSGQVVDDTQISIYDFTAQQDNEIRVTIYRERDYSKSIFQGFLVVQNNSQPFLDPPFTLSLKALDGLGLLKNVDMIDTTGALYAGVLSIEDWIGNILYKTGQSLNLRGYFPFFPALGSETMPPLQQVFLNAQAWLIGEITTTTDPSVDVFASEAVDAYTALTSICTACRARIFQEDGVWNFVCLGSYIDQGGMYYNESTGVLTAGIYHMTPVAVGNGLNYDVPVGSDQIVHPANDDTTLSLLIATKWVKLNYTYNQSFNKICNQNFVQGDPDPVHNGTISSTIVDPTIKPVVTLNYKAYQPFCWNIFAGTFAGGGTAPFPETPPTGYQYIRDVQDIYGYSLVRYLVIQSVVPVVHARSSTFLIDQGDLLTVNLDFRTYSDLGTVGLAPLIICLQGDDGSHWALGSFGTSDTVGTRWIAVDANYQTLSVTPGIYHSYTTGDPTSDWVTYTADKNAIGGLNKVPVSGKAFIVLEGLPSATESWYKNITATIAPFLQGSYAQLKGDFNFLSSNLNIKQTLSQDINISDSPKRYFQGALVDANNNLIPPTWHRRSFAESKRFTQLMGQIAYNNLNRILNKIEGTMRGLTWVDASLTTKQTGFLNRYYFTDHPTPTKKFVLTSFEKDYTTGQGRHVFIEILADQNDTGWQDPDTYVFQYLFQ